MMEKEELRIFIRNEIKKYLIDIMFEDDPSLIMYRKKKLQLGDMMVCDKCKKEIQEKIKLYLYYVGTHEGAKEFIELDKAGETDKDELAGTTRIFKYCFKDLMKNLDVR